MNRLIIVGNGFDLAHGLPTGYGHFVNWFWKNLRFTYKSESVKQLVHIDEMNYLFVENDINCFNDFLQNLEEYSKDRYEFNRNDLICHKPGNSFSPIFKFKNDFFKMICKNHSIQNWVDIENEYYRILKRILVEERKKEDANKPSDNKSIIKLNQEFEEVKLLLERYLIEEVEKKYDYEKWHEKLEQIIAKIDYRGNEIIKYLKELPDEDSKEIKNELNLESKAISYGSTKEFEIKHTHFLSFNYTSLLSNIVRNYSSELFTVNQIHGILNNSKNPINFGFGDEMDGRYQEIEERNDNEFLTNIKSFAYSNTPNYKSLLDFVDSEKYQVYIMGHSCGLSDRTLLNTVFEHHNCRSIKIYYYKNHNRDNYTEIVQNISRHFNKKKLMREKIVNKTLCEEMPQIKLPLKN